MQWYKCLVNGEKFPGVLANEKEPIGFFITRFVEASSVDEAELKALAELKEHESMKLPSNVVPPNSAKVYFDSIDEIESEKVPKIQPGFTFYVMGS